MKIFQNKLICVILVVLAAGGVYANSLGGEFVYDDKAMILAYDLVKDIGNLPKAFTSATSVYGNVNYYRPLQTASYMIDYFLWGRVAGGFHLTNIALHMASSALVFLLLFLLFKDSILSLLSALFFAVHPAHATVVSYIAGRADSMLLAAMLLSFVFYVKHRYYDAGKGAYVLSAIAFLIALLSKELAMIIPIALLVLDKYGHRYTKLASGPSKNSLGSMPFFIIVGIYLMIRVLNAGFFVEGAIRPFPLKNRLITVPWNIFEYIRMIIAPYDMHMGREPWVALSVLTGKILTSLVFVTGVFFAGYKLRFRMKPLWFGLCWFILFIFPSLNIITPLFYTIAENWLYIPSVGLFLALAYLTTSTYKLFEEKGLSVFKILIVCLAGGYILAMGTVAVRYNSTWKDEITLGENTLRYNPREFKVYNNIGVAYLGRGDLESAEAAFKKCLEIKPDTGMAYFNLYRVYMAKGKRQEARAYLQRARELDPRRVNILVEKMGIRD